MTESASASAREGAAGPAHQPLKGLVAVELGHSVAAPFAGRVLADLGATVVKIENPDGGDDTRKWGPPFWHGTAPTFGIYNCNKHSAAIDIKDGAQRAALRTFLVEKADIVVQNMRHGLVGHYGLDAASLRTDNPRLIYCNLGAFGAKGPLRQKPGYDPLMQAFGGIMSITGEEGRPPVRVGPSIVDMSTGMWAVIGILAALHRRAATGEGAEVDTSLYEATLAWVGSPIAAYTASGKVPGRRGSEMIGIVPYKVYKAADGWLMVAAGNDNLFRRLAEAIGKAEWLADARFATNPARVENRDHVNATLEAVISSAPRAHWMEVLGRVGVPCAPLQTLDEVASHAQTGALGMVQPTPDGAQAYMGTPLSFEGRRPPLERGPPPLGADTAMVLGEAAGEATAGATARATAGRAPQRRES